MRCSDVWYYIKYAQLRKQRLVRVDIRIKYIRKLSCTWYSILILGRGINLYLQHSDRTYHLHFFFDIVVASNNNNSI